MTVTTKTIEQPGLSIATPDDGSVEFHPNTPADMPKLMDVLSDIQMELAVPKGQYNSYAKYNFRNIEDINLAVKPLCKERNSLHTYGFKVTEVGGWHYLTATCYLVTPYGYVLSRASAREQETMTGREAAQITGGCQTYAAKYAAQALFAIDGEVDPDERSSKVKQPAQQTQQQQVQQPPQRPAQQVQQPQQQVQQGEQPDGALAQGATYPDGVFTARCAHCQQLVDGFAASLVGEYACPTCGHKRDWVVA